MVVQYIENVKSKALRSFYLLFHTEASALRFLDQPLLPAGCVAPMSGFGRVQAGPAVSWALIFPLSGSLAGSREAALLGSRSERLVSARRGGLLSLCRILTLASVPVWRVCDPRG